MNSDVRLPKRTDNSLSSIAAWSLHGDGPRIAQNSGLWRVTNKEDSPEEAS